MEHDDSKADAIKLTRLEGRVTAMAQSLRRVEGKQEHLDGCIDSLKKQQTELYNALMILHNPRKWASENWFGILLVVIIIGLITSVPNAFASKFVTLVLGLHG